MPWTFAGLCALFTLLSMTVHLVISLLSLSRGLQALLGGTPGPDPEPPYLQQPSRGSHQHERAKRKEHEVVVAVIGVTGCGKSTFIKTVTQRNDVRVGKDLRSTTNAVQSYSVRLRGIQFVLVDTPGFDDTEKDDEEVLENIGDWLKTSYTEGTRLNALLYFHRLTDIRMEGSALKNFRMFRKLCGPDCVKNIVLGTTFWSKVDVHTGHAREAELCENANFWGELIRRGSRVERITTDREKCVELVLSLTKNASVTLQAQDEMVGQGLQVSETAAASALGNTEKVQEIKKANTQRLAELKRLNEARISQVEESFRRNRDRAQEVLEANRKRQEQEAENIRQLYDMEIKVIEKRRQERLEEERLRQQEIHRKQEEAAKRLLKAQNLQAAKMKHEQRDRERRFALLLSKTVHKEGTLISKAGEKGLIKANADDDFAVPPCFRCFRPCITKEYYGG